ncbi:hypothetical protein SAMN05216276_101592 [Streptosporangium subroseum]|uniref:Uncharacterized protein n=1 Tax=Streptosporangium subroseum TaxID=106412 RepID=A0A239H4J3_9ACTN|nr:hypothetical protein SAMN05216276_101592 [Streptosporangium subroseum]
MRAGGTGPGGAVDEDVALLWGEDLLTRQNPR